MSKQKKYTQEQIDEIIAKLKKTNSDVQKSLEYGYSRWLDEKDYEDIEEYEVLFKEKVEANGLTFKKMTKRPFGFQATIEHLTIQFYCNARMVGYKVK